MTSPITITDSNDVNLKHQEDEKLHFDSQGLKRKPTLFDGVKNLLGKTTKTEDVDSGNLNEKRSNTLLGDEF